jgi:hypothetical protein
MGGAIRPGIAAEAAGEAIDDPDEKEPDEQQIENQQRYAEKKGIAVEDLKKGKREEHNIKN